MKLIDTHCHLDFPDYKDDLDEVIKRAEDAGVVRIISPGTNIESSQKAVEIAHKFAPVYAAVGIHPHEAAKSDSASAGKIRAMAINSEKVVGIGEIGLDYCKAYSPREDQKKLFRTLLCLSKELDLPVIMHNRDADPDFTDIIKSDEFAGIRGVVHCFSASREFLREVLSKGLYVSFTGTITFENASLIRELVKYTPVESLLLETDSPFMAPVPRRGKRNEPSFARHLLKTHAGIYSLSEEDIARVTTHNANRLFHLGMEEKGMVAYKIRDSLYLNITNRCTNRCVFCTRDISNYVKGHNLKLEREPLAEEVIKAISEKSGYSEVVFCGFGEPTLRLEVIKKIAGYVKSSGRRVRLTTNGEGNLINGRNIVPELKGLIDSCSVSLNAPDGDRYEKLCRPVSGKGAFSAISAFIGDSAACGIEVEVTCLDMIGEEAVARCREISNSLGARFRLRHLNVVG
ncbi:MAG: TatD family hydrolase [Candidatus Omnitrophota bacterium]